MSREIVPISWTSVPHEQLDFSSSVNISKSSISGFSSLLFEPILRYAGFFWTKLAMSVMTTGGAVLLAFYADNNDLIIWAWNLMGFPSVMYIILNINEQAPRFPSISGLTIGNDTDLTLWLAFKLGSDWLINSVSLKRSYQRSLWCLCWYIPYI